MRSAASRLWEGDERPKHVSLSFSGSVWHQAVTGQHGDSIKDIQPRGELDVLIPAALAELDSASALFEVGEQIRLLRPEGGGADCGLRRVYPRDRSEHSARAEVIFEGEPQHSFVRWLLPPFAACEHCSIRLMELGKVGGSACRGGGI